MPSHNQHKELSEGENSRVSPRAGADQAVRFDRPCPRQGELVWLPPVAANPQPSAARLKFNGGIICLKENHSFSCEICLMICHVCGGCALAAASGACWWPAKRGATAGTLIKTNTGPGVTPTAPPFPGTTATSNPVSKKEARGPDPPHPPHPEVPRGTR